MTQTNSNYRELAERALDAFWQIVVQDYPEARTGDLSPWTTFLLGKAAEDAIAEWVWANVPHANR